MKCGNPIMMTLLVSLSIFVQAQSNQYRIESVDEFINQKSVFSSSENDLFLYLKPFEGKQVPGSIDFEVLSHDSERGFLTRISEEVDVSNLAEIYSIEYIGPEEKLSPLIRKDQDQSSFNLWFHSSVDVNVELNELSKSVAFEIVDVNVDQKKAEVIIDMEDLIPVQNFGSIRYISPTFHSPRMLMDNSINLARANVLQSQIGIGSGLFGEGIDVGVWDGGLVGRHIDLDFNVINEEKVFFSAGYSQHATHVSGIIGAKSVLAPNLIGIAPKAQIHAYNFFGDVVSEIKTAVLDKNVSVTNSSFALPGYTLDCFTSGMYLPEAAELDKLTYENETVNHVVAVGNSGFGLCDDPYSTIEIGFQGAKNNITVGWTDVNENIWIGSSRGPTIDGRLKPELVAEGAQVISNSTENGYQNRWGSSQSSPVVAGIVALLSEQYKNSKGSLPRADLIKAVLCTGARDMGPEGADFTWGFGLANAYLSNEILKNENYYLGELTDGDSISFDITIPAQTEYLRATLVWTDKETVLPASRILVNDLDFKISGPSATILPWVNDPNNPSAAPTRGADHLNNIEGISLMNPDGGTYTVKVKASDVPLGSQKFAVAYQFGGANEMKVTHPVGGEKWVPGTGRYIRWDDFGLNETYDLEYSLDNGSTWTTIVTDLPATSRFHVWIVPNVKSHEAKVRVKTATHQSESEVFTIMAPVANLTGTVCNNHIVLNWPALPVASAYDILQLNEMGEFIKIGTSTTTTFVVDNITEGNEYWLTVVAKDENGSSRRATPILFTGSGGNCDFSNDIGISKLLSPLGGHKLTNSELTNAETISVQLSNFSLDTLSDFDLCYSIDNGVSICESFTGDLLPNETQDFSFSTAADLSVSGERKVSAWTNFIGDLNQENDTLNELIIVDENLPITLPYTEGFENIGKAVFVGDKIALNNLHKFDFHASTSEGRLRVSGPEQFSQEGVGAITLDNFVGNAENLNEVILNLNLSDFIDSNLYLNFDYLNHGQVENTADAVYVRGSDSDAWIEIFKLENNSTGSGLYTNVERLALTTPLLQNAQNFSSSSQIKFTQNGKYDATYLNTSNGYSFDNIKIYNAGVDLKLDGILSTGFRCGLDSFQLSIQVTNLNPISAATNVEVAYQLNGGDFVVESKGNIDPSLSKIITFDEYISLPKGSHSLVVEVRYPDDLELSNNIIDDFQLVLNETKIFIEEDLVTFELDQEWIPGGENSSWEWGSPMNNFIAQSGEGDQSIVSNLVGSYNQSENSYLGSSCYDFTAESGDIQLGFLGILDIETDFDGVNFEYSEDGSNWSVLGTNGSGFNWFNNGNGGDYWDKDIKTWQTFSNTLSLNSLSDKSAVLFRLRLLSDEFVNEEGLGIDNFFLTTVDFDLNDTILGQITSEVNTTTDTWSNVTDDGNLGAQIATSEDLTAVVGWSNDQDCFEDKHLADRSYFVTSSDASSISQLRLVLSNKEYLNLTQRAQAMNPVQGELGVLAYTGLNVDHNIDNNLGNYVLIEPESVEVIPYKNGYLIEFDALPQSAEYYIYYNQLDANLSFVTSFDASLDLNEDIAIDWSVNQVEGMDQFLVEISRDGLTFDSLTTTLTTEVLAYSLSDNSSSQRDTLYYRLLVKFDNGTVKFGGMDTLIFDEIICESENFNFTYTATTENCNQSDATVNIEVNNGVRPFVYQWPNIISTGNDSLLTGLAEGTFLMTVSDDDNCIYTDTIVINGRQPEIELEVISFVSCNGASDGFINIAVNDGLFDGSLLWSTGEVGRSIDSLSQGTYTVNYSDNDGCITEATYGILENDSLSIQVDSVVDASTGMSDGAIYVSVEGGSGFYTFQWSDESSSEDLLNVGVGDYQLLVTDDNGCVDSIDVRVDDVVLVNQEILNGLMIYPNPTYDRINISFDSERYISALMVSSIDGKKLIERPMQQLQTKQLEVEVGDLDKGVYFLTLEFESEKYTHVFLKLDK